MLQRVSFCYDFHNLAQSQEHYGEALNLKTMQRRMYTLEAAFLEGTHKGNWHVASYRKHCFSKTN